MRFYELTTPFRRWLDGQDRYPIEQRQRFISALNAVDPSDGVRALYPQHYRLHLAERDPALMTTFDEVIGEIPERPADFAPLRQSLAAILFSALTTRVSGDIEDDVVSFAEITAERYSTYSPTQALKRISGDNLLGFFRNVRLILPTLYNRGKATIVEGTGEDMLRILVQDLSGAPLTHLVWRGTARHMSAVPYVITTGALGPERFLFQVETPKV